MPLRIGGHSEGRGVIRIRRVDDLLVVPPRIHQSAPLLTVVAVVNHPRAETPDVRREAGGGR